MIFIYVNLTLKEHFYFNLNKIEIKKQTIYLIFIYKWHKYNVNYFSLQVKTKLNGKRSGFFFRTPAPKFVPQFLGGLSWRLSLCSKILWRVSHDSISLARLYLSLARLSLWHVQILCSPPAPARLHHAGTKRFVYVLFVLDFVYAICVYVFVCVQFVYTRFVYIRCVCMQGWSHV